MNRKIILLLSLVLFCSTARQHFLPAQSTPAIPDARTAQAAPPPVSPENAGTVEFKSLQSTILGQPLNLCVYLPASYVRGEQKYRVIYFLHGLFENERRWAERGGKELLDR